MQIAAARLRSWMTVPIAMLQEPRSATMKKGRPAKSATRLEPLYLEPAEVKL